MASLANPLAEYVTRRRPPVTTRSLLVRDVPDHTMTVAGGHRYLQEWIRKRCTVVSAAKANSIRQHWRCSACSNRGGKHSNPILLSKPIPVRESVVKDICVHNFRASTAEWLESLDKPKGDFESSLQSDHLENRSTPARCSNQSRHPERSSQQHHVQARIGLSAPSSSTRVQSRASIARCSGCQQGVLVVRPNDENPQRYVQKSHGCWQMLTGLQSALSK